MRESLGSMRKRLGAKSLEYRKEFSKRWIEANEKVVEDLLSKKQDKKQAKAEPKK